MVGSSDTIEKKLLFNESFKDQPLKVLVSFQLKKDKWFFFRFGLSGGVGVGVGDDDDDDDDDVLALVSCQWCQDLCEYDILIPS